MSSSCSTSIYANALRRLETRLREPSTLSLLGVSLGALGWAFSSSQGRKMLPELKAEESNEVVVCEMTPERWRTWKRLHCLLQIVIPGARSKESALIGTLIALIVVRISLTLRMTNIMGLLAGFAIEGDLRGLGAGFMKLLLICIPASLVDATLDYVREILELSFRLSLSKSLFHRYLSSKVFFRIAGLRAVPNVQLRLTDGVENWCATITKLFTSLSRAGLETIVFSRELKKRAGWKGLLLTLVFYGIFSLYAVRFAPSGERLGIRRLRLAGEFRTAHQNIYSFAEEISLTHQSHAIKELTTGLFRRITNHSRVASYLHCRFQLINVAIFRYGSAMLSILVGALGVFRATQLGEISGPDAAQNSVKALRFYSRTTHTFSVLTTALNHILANLRGFSALKGFTNQVYEVISELQLSEGDVPLPQQQSPITSHLTSPLTSPLSSTTGFTVSSYSRTVSQGDHIQFINVPLTLPSGKCICPSLTFFVRPGMNLLITGPNGCGKSSTLRLLGELWPLQGGTLIKPPPKQLYYVPQRPYMFDGTLLEQMIYPQKPEDFQGDVAALQRLLEVVGLEYLTEEGKLSWDGYIGDTLSSGEKQSLALARLFYHAPQYAILDECSSAMDTDAERRAYEHCQKLGISLITVAHRRSVWKYHNWVLRFDGRGGYLFSPLEVDERRGKIHLTCIEQCGNLKTIGKSMSFSFEEIVTEKTVLSPLFGP